MHSTEFYLRYVPLYVKWQWKNEGKKTEKSEELYVESKTYSGIRLKRNLRQSAVDRRMQIHFLQFYKWKRMEMLTNEHI